jgi:hypothetical protein
MASTTRIVATTTIKKARFAEFVSSVIRDEFYSTGFAEADKYV